MLLTEDFPGFGGVHVTVLDKLTYAGSRSNLEPVARHPRYTFSRGDICDAALLARLVPGHDVVINFAAETHVDRSITGAWDFVAANVTGVQVLLQACLEGGVGRVVQVSTDEVYGSITAGSWTKGAPLEPNSPYAAAKAGGDLMARAYARTHGLNVSITRCCNNYGPYQFPEKVIPLFVTNLLDGSQVPLYGDGGNVRDWIHVDDHCRGIQLVLERGEPGRVYHINGNAELTNVELTRALLDACGAGWAWCGPLKTARGTTVATHWTTRCCAVWATGPAFPLPTGSRPPCSGIRRTGPGGNRGNERPPGPFRSGPAGRARLCRRSREPVAGHRRSLDAGPGPYRCAGAHGRGSHRRHSLRA